MFGTRDIEEIQLLNGFNLEINPPPLWFGCCCCEAPICFISDPIMFIIGSVPFHRCSRSWHTWFFIPSEWWVSQKLNAFVDSSPYGIISKKEFCLVRSTRSLDFLWLIVLKNDTFSSVFSQLLVALPFICIVILYIIYYICMRFSHELVFLTHVLYTMKAQRRNTFEYFREKPFR